MMKEYNLVKICLEDRKDALKGYKLKWYRRNGFDLIVKFFILLFNSYGQKNCEDYTYIFVDEIKNSSMSNNLRDSWSVFENEGKKNKYMRFFQVNRKNHVHIGIYSSIVLVLYMLFRIILIILRSIFVSSVLEENMILLTEVYQKYLSILNENKVLFIMMTDHHFYSSITGLAYRKQSVVLQHGLMYRSHFFEPRAGHIFVWGVKSLEKIKNVEKAIVTGTYKFSQFPKREFEETDIRDVLFCVNSTDNENVKRKIKIIYEAMCRIDAHLIVKCHPGSLYSISDWVTAFKNTEIEFQKEKLIQDIHFDFAIMEDSTAILDVLMMKKRFLIFDDSNGYFSQYGDYLPRANSSDEIFQLIVEREKIDYRGINNALLTNELNGNRCTIVEQASSVMKKIYGIEQSDNI